MPTNNLRTDDASVQRFLSAIETQIDSMNRSAQGVEDVNNEIRQHFQAAASTKYQQKIEDWHAQYRQVIKAYQDLQEQMGRGHREIDAAHEHASDLAGGWSSDDVYNALNPS